MMGDIRLTQLGILLRPQGIYTVTTGGNVVARFLRGRYGTLDDSEILSQWRKTLAGIPKAKVVVLGIPSDVGAGFARGSFLGPAGIRTQFLSKEGLYERLAAQGIIDIGDVRVHPSLLHDSMMSAALKAHMRRERYGSLGTRYRLPVAPLSILERAIELISYLNPEARVLILGGDHSVSWAPISALTRHPRNRRKDLGIVHFDAHTDLFRERDGVEFSFATWAYHANEAIGRGRRLQQLGIRTSSREKIHWEEALGVRQYWMVEVRQRGIEAVTREMLDSFQEIGVRRVYISNDIDGTDPRYAAATGTMEPDGLSPQDVAHVIRAVGENFPVIGSDVVEVAPTLNLSVPGEPARTLQTAAFYTFAQLQAMAGPTLEMENPFAIPEPSSHSRRSLHD